MISRRGFLLAEETVKIILALIVVSFLVYLLSSLYFANKREADLEFADASLKKIIESIDGGLSEVEIYNPGGWYLLGWPYQNVAPKSCSNLGWENCLCICRNQGKGISVPGIHTVVTPSNLAESCDELGVCKSIDQKIFINKLKGEPLQLKPIPTKLEIKYTDVSVEIAKLE